ncbi:MAG: hypothetical protein KDE35_01300 [Geminicoccaceae bacterium]|nr:hypothetical protein [Geminicoccaceae bacterium]
MFTRDDLLALTSETADPTVSVFVPVEREGMDASRTTIQLKNQVQEVERRLEQAGRAPADREAFLAPLHDLIERRALESLPAGGFVAYLTEEAQRGEWVPIALRPGHRIDDRVHVAPILPLFMESGRFLVLALQLDRVRLFEADRFAIHEIPAENLPSSIAEVMDRTEYQANVHFHGTGPTPTTGGPTTPKFHAAGRSPSDLEKAEIDRFLQRVAKAAASLLDARGLPLVLVADEQHEGDFRRHMKHRLFVEDAVAANPAGLDDDTLHARALERVGDRLSGNAERAIERLQTRRGQSPEQVLLVASDATSIGQAAREGRIEELLVDLDHPAMRDDASTSPRAALRGLEAAIAGVLQSGGRALVVEPGSLPDEAAAAALLRF